MLGEGEDFMGISGISSTNSSMSVMQMTSTDLKDQKSKSIQNEITDVQQKIRQLSSNEALSANEKANERKKLQKEKSSLDTELERHQEELLRSQKREIRLAELLKERNPEKEEKSDHNITSSGESSDPADEAGLRFDEKQTAQPGTVITQDNDGTVILKEVMKQAESAETDAENKPAEETNDAADTAETESTTAGPAADTRPPAQEMRAMISADSSMQLAARQGTLVTRTSDGIAILKGEIKQDELRGVDTERKQEELRKMQKQEQREMSFQFSILGEAGNAMQSASEKNVPMKDTQAGTERTFYVSGLNTAQEEQKLQQQGFQAHSTVSIPFKSVLP